MEDLAELLAYKRVLCHVGIGQQICQELAQRIMVIDGAMGTMIQSYKLGEDDFRGEYSSSTASI